MSSFSGIIYPEPLRSIDSATFTGAYQAVGTPLAHAGRIVKFTNNSNVLVLLSWDGVTDHSVLPGTSFELLDVGTNRGSVHSFEIQQATQFYVKGAAGTGLFYITSYFAR